MNRAFSALNNRMFVVEGSTCVCESPMLPDTAAQNQPTSAEKSLPANIQ
jgi:hypothetical protein